VGTNYYAILEQPCPQCGRGGDRLHIGKSSAGWCFAVHVELDDPDFPHSWEKWWSRLKDGAAVIQDEYGRIVAPEKLRSYVEDRHFSGTGWTDRDLRDNGATRGPNGLARHILDGSRCVAHGAGTWDCLQGDFS
jgi:hypothetical protein